MDADVMHEALVKKAHCFSDRPLHLWMVRLFFGGNGVVFQNGEKWEKIRRLVLSSMRSFGVGKPDMEQRIEEEVHHVIEEIGSRAQQQHAFDLKHTFHKAVCNVVCSVLFGRRYALSQTCTRTWNPCLFRLLQTTWFSLKQIYF